MIETFLIVDSSRIEQIWYNPDTSRMRVKFKKRTKDGVDTYEYGNVPREVFVALKDARSAGEYFDKNIKGTYTYAKVS